jgi:sulfur carrier protein
VNLIVNGEPQEFPGAGTVADLVGEPRRGVAVAVNGEVVPRRGWPATPLHDGDRIEVLTAAQGG